ncbi:MAG TPA: hypothetical protein VLY04_05680 [Bryobacteraceae bacterium]|nr:hypothetical protein [Bryobacteraceae bacterium]
MAAAPGRHRPAHGSARRHKRVLAGGGLAFAESSGLSSFPWRRL